MSVDSYYTMTVVVPIADWREVSAEILKAGDVPGMHEASTMAHVRGTFTWTFQESDIQASWSAYHGLVRAYAVCVARRLKCTFTTAGRDGKVYDVAFSPVSLDKRKTAT
ncbi:MAG: hypothetical protein A2V70_01145 [Planctomycetes bacterium RBG_13_63_9]|nr:MAG: hypothetical protein A2V70_01145 [Planctomycetes bacterium RBG_13_63_9]